MNFNMDKIKPNILILVLVGLTIILAIIIYIHSSNKNINESFTNAEEVQTIETQLLSKYESDLTGKSQADLVDYAARLRLRLDKFGLYPGGSSPDLSKYALKSEVLPGANGQCIVATAIDRDKYMSKSDLPDPVPRIDLSKYVLKSSIPPEKICPPQQEIDYSKYVLKSSLPPPQKCPPCICPKVKVSAGLCQQCPPAPSCPPPQPCEQKTCPEPQPCPAQGACPQVQACPTPSTKTFYDVKYIKVPTIITKTITLDANGNVMNQKIQTENTTAAANGSASSFTGGNTQDEYDYATTITSSPSQQSASNNSSYASYQGSSTPSQEETTSYNVNQSALPSYSSSSSIQNQTSSSQAQAQASSIQAQGQAQVQGQTSSLIQAPPSNFQANLSRPVSTSNPSNSTQYAYFNPDLNSAFKRSGSPYGIPYPY